MSEKSTNIVTLIVVGIAVVGTLLMSLFSKAVEPVPCPRKMDYATELFDGKVFDLEILCSAEMWQRILDEAMLEQYQPVDVRINGTLFRHVGIRAKGNSSLMQLVGNPDSNRYSFKIKFNQYIDGQTCFGLDMLVLNNLLHDNTYMKEYFVFDMMKYLEVDCQLFGYSRIRVNGTPWGLYFAMEAYNRSYLSRVYGTEEGLLYNAKLMDMGKMGQHKKSGFPGGPMGPPPAGFPGDLKDFPGGPNRPGNFPGSFGGSTEDKKSNGTSSDQQKETAGVPVMPPGFPGEPGEFRDSGPFRGPGGPGMLGTKGTDLKYRGDSSSCYTGLFDNCVGNRADHRAEKRVIKAVQVLNEQKNLEQYWNVDKILRYFAAHTVAVSMDSYTGHMCQNYYLYEYKGVLTMLPWDYNDAFGGMLRGGVHAVVNFPIDTPVEGISMEERPLLNILLNDKNYRQRYHRYLAQLLPYLSQAEEKVATLNQKIADQVKNDPTAFCTYEEYQKAQEEFGKLLKLRGKSIAGQLTGSVPSTTDAQTANPERLLPCEADDFTHLFHLRGMGGPPGMGSSPEMSGPPSRGGPPELPDFAGKSEPGKERKGMFPPPFPMGPNPSRSFEQIWKENQKVLLGVAISLIVLTLSGIYIKRY